MPAAAANPDKVTSTIKAIGTGVFLCIPVLWLFGIATAKDQPVPIEVQGCYESGQQTLEVQGTRIIVNGRLYPKVDVRYMLTNTGRLIETVNGSWLEIDQAEPPHKQVARNAIIRVQDNALLAYTPDGEAIPFWRVTRPATCRSVGNRLNSA